MSEITTIGIDIAKNVFQIHGVYETGGVVVRRQLGYGDSALILTSEISALSP